MILNLKKVKMKTQKIAVYKLFIIEAAIIIAAAKDGFYYGPTIGAVLGCIAGPLGTYIGTIVGLVCEVVIRTQIF
jgi:LytS/YehU family sensor histidine kinase